MVLSPDAQTRNFPSLGQMEQSWEQNLRKSMELLAPGDGIRSGLKLGLPLTGGGLVTTGLLPTLTNGYLMKGDQVLGPYASKFTKAAAASQTNKNIFFGLKGMDYGDASNAAPYTGDIRIGSLSTDATTILHLGQQYNYGACRFGVRGVVNLARCVKGSDVTYFTWTFPSIGLDNVRLIYAQARVMEAVSAGNATGDDFLFKIKNGADAAVTLGTIAAASLTAGTIIRKNVLTADVLSFFQPTTIAFQYNQTDASANFAGGAIEVMAVLEAF
jgi:hypothetical protein